MDPRKAAASCPLFGDMQNLLYEILIMSFFLHVEGEVNFLLLLVMAKGEEIKVHTHEENNKHAVTDVKCRYPPRALSASSKKTALLCPL